MSTPPGGQPPYDPNQPQDPNQGYGAPPPPPGGGGSYPSYPTEPSGGGYGQPPYNQPQYGGQPGGGGNQTNGLAITSLVTGILGLPLLCCFWIGVLLSVAAIVTGFMGKKKADESGGRVGGRGMAVAGIILGVVGIVITVVLVILVFVTGSFEYNYGTDVG